MLTQRWSSACGRLVRGAPGTTTHEKEVKEAELDRRVSWAQILGSVIVPTPQCKWFLSGIEKTLGFYCPVGHKPVLSLTEQSILSMPFPWLYTSQFLKCSFNQLYSPADFLVNELNQSLAWAPYNIGIGVMFLTILKFFFWQLLHALSPQWLSWALQVTSNLLMVACEFLSLDCAHLLITHPTHAAFTCSECAHSSPSQDLWTSCSFWQECSFSKLSPTASFLSLRSQLTSHLLREPESDH